MLLKVMEMNGMFAPRKAFYIALPLHYYINTLHYEQFWFKKWTFFLKNANTGKQKKNFFRRKFRNIFQLLLN